MTTLIAYGITPVVQIIAIFSPILFPAVIMLLEGGKKGKEL